MSEWKGPRKCKKCGTITDESPHFSMWVGKQNQLCDGDLVPYDRRAPNPLLPLVKELREALVLYGRHQPGCTAFAPPAYRRHMDKCTCKWAQAGKNLVARADKALEEEKR